MTWPALRLAETAREADSDSFRNRLREVYLTSLSDADAITVLRYLAESARPDELPPVSLHLLGAKLLALGDRAAAEKLLRKARRHHPGDYWLNQTLARCLDRAGRRKEAIWYYIAAQAIRPGMTHEIAHCLWSLGRAEEAIAALEDIIAGPTIENTMVITAAWKRCFGT